MDDELKYDKYRFLSRHASCFSQVFKVVSVVFCPAVYMRMRLQLVWPCPAVFPAQEVVNMRVLDTCKSLFIVTGLDVVANQKSNPGERHYQQHGREIAVFPESFSK